MLKESLTVEFKREVTDSIKREVIAFVNTIGGELYIGIEDDGTVIGVPNIHKQVEAVSSMLHDSIHPDILGHLLIESITLNHHDVIKLTVTQGTRKPYYLKSKGMKPSGVFIRYGTSVTNASDERIRQMIMEADGTNFEDMRSVQQQLTFVEAERIFAQQGIPFGEEQRRTLRLMTDEGDYTNVARLLSDQCDHTIKCARYVGEDKLQFQDRKEFVGSILKQIEDVYDYLSLYNNKSVSFAGLQRIEREEYPSYAVREALINAVAHRDYSFSSSTLIHLFTNRIEFVSIGGLVRGLTVADIELGISQSRNRKLADVLYRLKWIESYGTGLQRMKESYAHSSQQPSWQVSPNAFVVTLPKQQVETETEPFLLQHDVFTARQLEQYNGQSKSTTRQLLERWLREGKIIRQGNGRATTYKRL